MPAEDDQQRRLDTRLRADPASLIAWIGGRAAFDQRSYFVYSFASHVVPAAVAREYARADGLGCVRGWRIWKERVTVHTSVRNRLASLSPRRSFVSHPSLGRVPASALSVFYGIARPTTSDYRRAGTNSRDAERELPIKGKSYVPTSSRENKWNSLKIVAVVGQASCWRNEMQHVRFAVLGKRQCNWICIRC